MFFAFPRTTLDYAELAVGLREVADQHHAERAVGVSMGAGALCRVLAETPDRFDRVVLFLPAVLDQPRPPAAREHWFALADALETGDPSTVVEREIPPPHRGTAAARAYVRQRSIALSGMADTVRAFPDLIAVADPEALSRVRAPVLVVGNRDDPLHPVEIAVELANILPDATLHIYDEPGVLWNARADLRARISGFLNAS